jgi:type I restriction enzyme S subunit
MPSSAMSKISEGEIPSDWVEVPLSSVTDVRVSGVDKLSRESEEPVRLCNYIDVYKNDYITGDLHFMEATATTPEIERFGLRVGDVIITKDSETPDDIGISAVVDYAAPDLVYGYHLALVRPRAQEVDSTFLAKQLKHYRLARYFGQRANGLTRYGLPNAVVANVPVWLPELPKRKAIGAILRLVDEAIAKTEAVITKLKQVRAGLLHDLLTRGLDLSACNAQAGEHGQLRDPVAHPEQFEDSPLGRIPREWLCRTLQEAAEWFSGGTPDRSQPSLWQGNVPLLTPKDMKVFELSDTTEHISDAAVQIGSRLMPEGTVFIVVRGMILAHTFPVCLSTRPFGFNQDIKAVRGRAGLTNRFLGHWFVANSPLFLRKATEATHGTKKLDLDELYRVYIGIPSLVEQQAIVDQVELMNSNIKFTTADNIKLDQLKFGLMNDLLTGRVRVPEGIAVTG